MKQPLWTPLNLAAVGAGSPFKVRASGAAAVTVVANQFGQLLDAGSQALLGFVPDEMSLAEAEIKPAKPVSPTAG